MTGYFGLTEGSVNCTQPAIEDFPPDFFTKEQRQMGAIVLHATGSLYLFLALAVVCDKYFVPAVEKICQALNMSNDVAGATFMAAATSAPELFVNVIGTFITEGDIGIGTIVGSAVFNILAVAACCGIGAGMVVPLDWWPLTRDCLAYGITVAILICIIHDERVEWYEALTLVLLYIVYIAVMYYDKSIQKCARGGVRHARSRSRRSHRGGSLESNKLSHEQDRILPLAVDHFQQNGNIKNITHIDSSNNNNNNNNNNIDELTNVETPPTVTTVTDDLINANNNKLSSKNINNININNNNNNNNNNNRNIEQLELELVQSSSTQEQQQQQQQQLQSPQSQPKTEVTVTSSSSVIAANDDNNKVLPIGYSLIRYPSEKTCFRQIMWVVIWPIHLLFMFTIPDCERPKLKKLFPLTFLMCIIWIGSLSYMVAWMITIIGDTLQIPDSVMGITFLAAGTSVPEAVSSVIVAKQGHGSMGISNSIGSNTFDILLCLGLPWLIKASFLPTQKGLHWVAINSAGLEYSAISLLSTLLMLYIVFSLNKFKLDRKVGHTCLFMYAVFLVLATLIELNVFFTVNVPTCTDAKK